jgi:hypothetical protein
MLEMAAQIHVLLMQLLPPVSLLFSHISEHAFMISKNTWTSSSHYIHQASLLPANYLTEQYCFNKEDLGNTEICQLLSESNPVWPYVVLAACRHTQCFADCTQHWSHVIEPSVPLTQEPAAEQYHEQRNPLHPSSLPEIKCVIHFNWGHAIA